MFYVSVCSSKRSCESAGSLGKVNLAVADGSKLITAWSYGVLEQEEYLALWKQLFGLERNITNYNEATC